MSGLTYNAGTSPMWIACQNCGEPVLVTLPFVGCMFCEKCVGSVDSYTAIGTEDFTGKYQIANTLTWFNPLDYIYKPELVPHKP